MSEFPADCKSLLSLGKLTKDFDGSPDAGDEEGHVEHPAEGLELGEELDGGVGQELDQRRGQDDGAAHNLVVRWVEVNAHGK